MDAPVSGEGAALAPGVEWGLAARALAGETVSGDAGVLAPFAGGVLAAVVDGLGHGPAAAAAAEAATTALRDDLRHSPTTLMQRCHAASRQTRGVVLSLASFSIADAAMTWLGVGNVEGVLFRAKTGAASSRETLLLRGGVVGYRLPPLREARLAVSRGDTLVLATDGISHHFSELAPHGSGAQEHADHILARCGKQTDDALVLVVRYLGQRQ